MSDLAIAFTLAAIGAAIIFMIGFYAGRMYEIRLANRDLMARHAAMELQQSQGEWWAAQQAKAQRQADSEREEQRAQQNEAWRRQREAARNQRGVP